MIIPGSANPLLLGGEGYQISRSVRLRSSASAYFNRTPASATNQKTWTYSLWVKRGTLGAVQDLMVVGSNVAGQQSTQFLFNSNDTIELFDGLAGSTTNILFDTTQVFRDPSAWYHLVLAMDTTQATNTNRVKLYVNGLQITSFTSSTYPSQNFNTLVNAASAHYIGRFSNVSVNYLDGYLTEINFIDGQALTPSSFGEYNAITGVWQPKKYGGTYGTNGFYLNFSDPSAATAAAIGKDSSGNGNNWTPNNISVTAGVTYDSMLDVPTPYADGGNGRGNYCVINPLKKPSTSTITDGNLNVTWTTLGGEQPASFAQSSGKWYWEQTQNAAFAAPGIILDTAVPSGSSISQGYHYYGNNGQFYTATSGVAYGATFTTGDIIGVALDLDNNQITFYKNNVSQGTKSIAAGSYTPDLASAGTITINANFGQRPFTYTPPTGFKALNTQNLPDSTINNGAKYMAATLYSGNSGTQTISNASNGVSFQPDLVWVKSRTNPAQGYYHFLQDSVRGISSGYYSTLNSNTTDAENAVTPPATYGGMTAITSSGFTVAGSGSNYFENLSGTPYVAWQWKANGSAVSNTAGSITSQVNANPTAGFSVVTYTGTGANATVGHGLGVAPKMVIVKRRDSGPSSWTAWQTTFSSIEYIYLNLNNAKSSSSGATVWNSATPTSSVFSVGTYTDVNASAGTFVAYCWSEVAGYSKFGSYTGNGSTDGAFVYLGFRPRYLMVKAVSSVADWDAFDTSRDPYNATQQFLFPNLSSAEFTSPRIDLLSNGFKLRAVGDPNNSGVTYIYAAFAENPFKNSLAR